MVERGSGLRLLNEALLLGFTRLHIRGKELYCHDAVQLKVAGLEDFAHSTSPNCFQDFVMGDALHLRLHDYTSKPERAARLSNPAETLAIWRLRSVARSSIYCSTAGLSRRLLSSFMSRVHSPSNSVAQTKPSRTNHSVRLSSAALRRSPSLNR